MHNHKLSFIGDWRGALSRCRVHPCLLTGPESCLYAMSVLLHFVHGDVRGVIPYALSTREDPLVGPTGAKLSMGDVPAHMTIFFVIAWTIWK
jgi:hypothetical protein